MAKPRRTKKSVRPEEYIELLESDANRSLSARTFSKLQDVFCPDDPGKRLDALEWILFTGVILLTLAMPFLYSRATTENFLTPKEFTSKIALAFFGVLFCTRFAFNRRIELAKTSLDLPIMMFFGLAVLSIAWNYNIPSAIRDLRGTFLIMLLFPIIVNTFKNRWQVEALLWTMAIAAAATSAIGIMEAYNLYFRFDPHFGWVFARDEIFAKHIDPRAWYVPLFPQLANAGYTMFSIVSTFGNRNYLGTFVMFCSFIPISFYFYYRNIIARAVSIAIFGWLVFGLYITRCRAALIGIAAGVVYVLIFFCLCDRNWKLVKRNMVFFILIAATLIGGFVVATRTAKSESMLDKLGTALKLTRSSSTNTYERIWVWYATVQSFAKSPFKWLFGSGYGAYKHFFPLQESETFSDENKETFTSVTFRQTHNDWLQLVSELGLVGLAFFLFLFHRFFAGIYRAVRREAWSGPDAGMLPDHILPIGIGAAMVSQLVAAIPDFPFHRIETAFYAVLFLALVPVILETSFFRYPLRRKALAIRQSGVVWLTTIFILAGLMAIHHEQRCWQADELVRLADSRLRNSHDPREVMNAKRELEHAVSIDSLPGDPYLKLSTILAMENKPAEAIEMAERAWKNINFNARSTYHSIVFRKMHILSSIMGNKKDALEQALLGLFLTAGDARSVYYFYAGKLAYELGDMKRAEWALTRAMNYPTFLSQAAANLAVVKAQTQQWNEAFALSASVSAQVFDTDAMMLDIMGISASNLGKHDIAETSLRKAVALSPNQPVYKRDLGVVLLRKNNIIEAGDLLEQSLEAGSLPDALRKETEAIVASISLQVYMTGTALASGGQVNEAVRLMKEVYESKYADPSIKTKALEYMKSYAESNQ